MGKFQKKRSTKAWDALLLLQASLNEDEKHFWKLLKDKFGDVATDEDGNYDPQLALNMLKQVNSATKAVVSELATHEKLTAQMEKYGAASAPVKNGRGALSSGQAWGASGWRLTPHGFSWQRPPNVSRQEHFISSATTHIAKYNEVDSFLDLPIYDYSKNLPVTEEQAKEFVAFDKMIAQYKKNAVRAAGKRTGTAFAPSGIAKADFDAKQDILNKRLNTLDRIKEFHQATVSSGFGRYVKAESELGTKIDDERNRKIEEQAKGKSDRDKDEQLRKTLLKELPPFFRNSKASTKDLEIAAKAWSDLKHTPFLGKLTSPSVAGIAAYGGIVSALNASDRANAKVSNWQNLGNVFGFGSKAFQEAAYMAGDEGPDQIASRIGRLAQMYGGSQNAERVLREVGVGLRGKTQEEKMYTMAGLQWNPADIMIAEILAGNVTPSEQMITRANKAKIEATKTYGLSSGSGISATAQSWWLSIPGMTSAQARDVESQSDRFKGTYLDKKQAMIDSYNSAMAGAMSGVRYDSTPNNNTTSVSSTDSHNVQINQTINTNGGDVEASRIVGDKIAEASRTAVIEKFDGKGQ